MARDGFVRGYPVGREVQLMIPRPRNGLVDDSLRYEYMAAIDLTSHT
jgi:hypothetical protein